MNFVGSFLYRVFGEIMKYWVFFVMMLALPLAGVWAEEVVTDAAVAETVAVKFHGEELFKVTNISSLPAQSRAARVAERLEEQAMSPLVNTDNIAIDHDDALGLSVIMSGPDMICSVLESDAKNNGVSRKELAERWRVLICDMIDQYRKDRTAESYMKSAIFAAISTAVFLLIWLVVRFLCHKEIEAVEKKFAGQKMFKFLEGDSIVTANGNLIKFVCTVMMICIFVLYLDLVLSFFPWMFNLSAKLFELISAPIITFGHAFVASLPDFFALLVIGLIVRFVLRILKHIFTQIGEGKVRVKGFFKDWADTTYSLVRIGILVFAFVAAFPYIPGSSSPAFKGISIFMGVLLSLGSTSVVGNVLGGLMLTYMRAFEPGDFVEINGMRGTVMLQRAFSTRLKTPTNEVISIPNTLVSTNPIVNYSRMPKSIGGNIGTTVTIGYDVPWRQVHELLLKSADGVDDVMESPSPIIRQLSLDDFYVKYKLFISTQHPERQLRILSDLHQNIQDNFSKANIEILSPYYQSNRDGEKTTIPTIERPEV